MSDKVVVREVLTNCIDNHAPDKKNWFLTAEQKGSLQESLINTLHSLSAKGAIQSFRLRSEKLPHYDYKDVLYITVTKGEQTDDEVYPEFAIVNFYSHKNIGNMVFNITFVEP